MQTTVFDRVGAAQIGAPTPHDRFFRRSVVAARLLALASTTVEVPDTVELPVDRPAIFAANHTSLFDLVASLICLGHFDLTARIGVNARYFSSAVGRQFLGRLGCSPFSRDRRAAAEGAMVDALGRGQLCALMPEGRIVRRSERGDGVGPARAGISRIARRAGAAIVPVGFTGSDRAWPPGSPFLRPGLGRDPVVARFGPPFLLADDDHDTNAARVMSAIAGCLRPKDLSG